MLRALLFDMGGTLDGDGQHWLDRFAGVYTDCGAPQPWARLRAAFDAAEAAAADADLASSGLTEMVRRHVAWQFAHLGLAAGHLADCIANRFVASVRLVAARNAHMLAELRAAGFVLGVVSNGCGNVATLCRELGYAPFLSIVVDSHRVGVQKPDPEIFRYAARALALPFAAIMMVGDSFDRDIRPARSLGMQTAWLEGPDGRDCPDPSCADVRLRTLPDLLRALHGRMPAPPPPAAAAFRQVDLA